MPLTPSESFAAAGQNCRRRENCATRASSAGTADEASTIFVDVICPRFEAFVTMFNAGAPKFAWLNRLNASARNVRASFLVSRI